MRESSLENRFNNKVKKSGGKALKFTSQGMNGMQDRLVLIPGGKVAFVELKAPGEKLEPLQEKRARDLRAMGFLVYKVDSKEAIDSFIAEVFE